MAFDDVGSHYDFFLVGYWKDAAVTIAQVKPGTRVANSWVVLPKGAAFGLNAALRRWTAGRHGRLDSSLVFGADAAK